MAKQSTSLTIKQHLQSPAMLEQIARALPAHITADKMARAALTAIGKTPKLASCDQASFFSALMTCSQLGLEPDGRLAHLIPYGTTCQLVIDYKGLVELMYRSGQIRAISAHVIYDGDDFGYELGKVTRYQPWEWRQGDDVPAKKGNRRGAWCRIELQSGAIHDEVMTAGEVESIRKSSRAGSNGPWVTHTDEMWKKTVARRASKWVPLSPEIRTHIAADDEPIEKPQRKATISIKSAIETLSVDSEPEAEPDPQADIDAMIASLEESLARVDDANEINLLGDAFDFDLSQYVGSDETKRAAAKRGSDAIKSRMEAINAK